jgi:predicted nucleic acid-binding protein
MSGRRFLLDTNAVIALLQGREALVALLRDAEWVGTSVITLIEFLAFPNLDDEGRRSFEDFLGRVDVVGLSSDDRDLIDTAVRLRQEHRLRLPDAVIAASALLREADLVTADAEFRKVPELPLVSP